MTLVHEFHTAFGLPAPAHPPLHPDPALVRLRARLIREEFEEVMAELAALATATTPEASRERLQALLKELADLRYVVEGCAVSLGLPLDEAYTEVHKSNMSKLGPNGRPLFRGDGKVLKGQNYREADIASLLPTIIDHQENQ